MLDGRVVGILIADGSDGTALPALNTALAAGARVKIIGPEFGGVQLAVGTLQPVDKQRVGAPSVIFYAIVIMLVVANTKNGKAITERTMAVPLIRVAAACCTPIWHENALNMRYPIPCQFPHATTADPPVRELASAPLVYRSTHRTACRDICCRP